MSKLEWNGFAKATTIWTCIAAAIVTIYSLFTTIQFSSALFIAQHTSLIAGQAMAPILQIEQTTQEQNINGATWLDKISNQYKGKLAQHKPFQQWLHSTVHSFPLHAHIPSWFIQVMQKEQQIGYMIIQVQGRHIVLTEYGLGEKQPFLSTQLQLFLNQRQQQRQAEEPEQVHEVAHIDPYYLGSLWTLWRITWKNGCVEWLDAQSGELLPLLLSHPLQLSSLPQPAEISVAQPHMLPAASHVVGPFYPYRDITWMAKMKPSVSSPIPFDYEQKKWIYVNRLHDAINKPYAYIGTQHWTVQQPVPIQKSIVRSTTNSDNISYLIVNPADMQTLCWVIVKNNILNGFFVPQSS